MLFYCSGCVKVTWICLVYLPLQTPTLLLTPSPLLSNIHFWSTLSPVAPLSPATRRQGAHLFQVSTWVYITSFCSYLVACSHSVQIWPNTSFFSCCSFRLSSPPSSRSLYTVWMGPTHLAPFHQTLKRHRINPPQHHILDPDSQTLSPLQLHLLHPHSGQ